MSYLSRFDEHDKLVDERKAVIKNIYLTNEKPWVLGYSGGKDSTATMQIIIESLQEIPVEQRTNHIYIISSDTLVETPLIISKITETLNKVQKFAEDIELPISTHRVYPSINNTFWVNLIGKGYPCPNQSFRWCTDRLKIQPSNDFILEKVSEHGEVIVVLGVREGESNSRDQVLKKKEIVENELMLHSSLPNAYVFAPIKPFTIDDVWSLLLNKPAPWGDDNSELFKLYSESSDSSECPLVIDESIKQEAGSCGNSRFGCWVCTVVQQDKSLTGFLNSGHTWLQPLLDYRNWLVDIRDDRSMRMKMRMNGQIYFSKTTVKNGKIEISAKNNRQKVSIDINSGKDNFGDHWRIFDSKELALEYIKNNNIDVTSAYDPKIISKTNQGYGVLGLGTFTYQARFEMLNDLLEMQRNLRIQRGEEIELIRDEEVLEIQRIWSEKGNWEYSAIDLYTSIYDRNLNVKDFSRENYLTKSMTHLLDEICQENAMDASIIKQLLHLENDCYGLMRRDKVQKGIHKILSKDYINV
ncbi:MULTISPECIES: DNA phosphorothioation system sulfurtransferase DndC [unclassified Breznakia]|uniref:DNA phosphorothioation system sulfurtransferase DndC n=1 Tax=unclassified Breznakia TaxID=2623764 RepID=UPI0024760A7D|nr:MULTISPECIES: DNA phosphorothioation system sulfurtransferase DndC [unclassified Breznakia]MDH6367983.1 DNA sulfur modification protein DndC [Breznakia sp. PH1-1]MDH6405086.1 DNA sulfur modification protein DndC [Breznakia sp. PF1-11]MDH6412786.1 DNA sulfur modification protein DndC [Breznakia sp. PFB1-11]MDH6415161.1 DNA sulfur modification protein DndC [Breznakia sp. PFB1-14]MDH6417472.1 DNA sulfur modification protein DndC [Breznakia sp. PFB1-4]